MKNVRLVSITKVSLFYPLQKFKKSIIGHIALYFLSEKLILGNVPKSRIIKNYVIGKLPIHRIFNLSVNGKSRMSVFLSMELYQEISENISIIIKNNQKPIKS
jgi:hypothetical protein